MPDDPKTSFKEITSRLKLMGRIPILKPENEGAVIMIGMRNFGHKFSATIPIILFIAVIATVSIDGWFRSLEFGAKDLFSSTILYVVGLLGIIGIHEMGHMAASYRHGIRSSLPYFIPGIPVITLPTFGALIMSKEPILNRDSLFDLGISGPLAGLAVTILVAIQGALTSKYIPTEEALILVNEGKILQLASSPLMNWIFESVSKTPDGMTMILSPLGFAAWLGFFITFLNLIPAGQLDGGHIARATVGRRVHKIASFGSVGLLILLGYTFMALLILFMMMRRVDARPLDDKSPLSNSRKILFVLILGLAILMAPIPLHF